MNAWGQASVHAPRNALGRPVLAENHQEFVHICEVGPRDGLQNEAVHLSIEDKSALIAGVLKAGLRQVEVGSFVSPKAVPAMADTDALTTMVKGTYSSGLRALGLVVNAKGFDRALAAGVDGVCIVTVVSESLCQKNNGCSSPAATATAVDLLKRAKANGLFARVDVATSWVCPYEGPIALEQVQRVADQIWEYQPDELAFCDSIGHAHPYQVASLFAAFGERYERSSLVAHFHDTQALGLANATAALLQGIRRFDSSLGGLGGCPFAPGAKGNLATEDLVHLCHRIGFETGISLTELWATIAELEPKIGRTLGGQSRSWFHATQHKTDNQEQKSRS